MFKKLGVLVTCKRGSKDPIKTRCSGIQLFNTGWVLTTGTVFGEELPDNVTSVLSNATKGLQRIPELAESSTFFVIGDPVDAIELSSVKMKEKKSTTVTRPVRVKFKASLEYVWRCRLVAQALYNLLHVTNWELGGPATAGKTGEDSGFGEEIRLELSVFVLLKLSSKQEEEWDIKTVLHKLYLELDHVHRGQSVYIESTLFGKSFFINSLSTGVLSNIVGPAGCLNLTDAHTAQGSEGAPMVTNAHLSGMVLSSLCWWQGEWVGFTLGASLKPIIYSLVYLLQGIPHSPATETATPLTWLIDHAVVMIRVGTASWGSGVVVDATSGTILTCSHVVNQVDNEPLTVYCNGKIITSVSLVYANRSSSPYDLAVLRVPAGTLKQDIPLATQPPQRGDVVWTAGFALLSERDEPKLKPTLSRGLVSQVHGSAMFHTTCCVQSGMSGGPVLRDGTLLGIMACHTCSVDSGARFPHINAGIPVNVFAKPLFYYLQSSDPSYLQDLETNNEEVQRIWKLKDVPPSKL